MLKAHRILKQQITAYMEQDKNFRMNILEIQILKDQMPQVSAHKDVLKINSTVLFTL